MLNPRIETKRLIIRRYELTDIDMLYELVTDSRLAVYTEYPKLSKEEWLGCIQEWIDTYDTNDKEKWVIEINDNHNTIGNISVNEVNKKDNYCSIGYVTRYDYWNKGYTTEALIAVTDYLLTKYKYIECSSLIDNKQSIRVLEKAGFKKKNKTNELISYIKSRG
jgi:ribosomal-protein-alanine N-acetyltransferase